MPNFIRSSSLQSVQMLRSEVREIAQDRNIPKFKFSSCHYFRQVLKLLCPLFSLPLRKLGCTPFNSKAWIMILSHSSHHILDGAAELGPTWGVAHETRTTGRHYTRGWSPTINSVHIITLSKIIPKSITSPGHQTHRSWKFPFSLYLHPHTLIYILFLPLMTSLCLLGLTTPLLLVSRISHESRELIWGLR